jgi:hypothetical protein
LLEIKLIPYYNTATSSIRNFLLKGRNISLSKEGGLNTSHMPGTREISSLFNEKNYLINKVKISFTGIRSSDFYVHSRI